MMDTEVHSASETKGTYVDLAVAIKHTLRIGLLLSGCFFAIQPGLADTSNLPTVDVPPPFDPPDYVPPDYTPPIDDYPDQGGGGGGGGDGTPPEVVCANLRQTKPNMCPNPIPMPSSANYAFDQLPHGSFFQQTKSTVRMAVAFSEGRAHGPNGPAQSNPTAAWVMNLVLEKQTANFANPGMPLQQANQIFREGLKSVCDLQLMNGAAGYRPPGGVTVPEQFCFDMMKSFDRETNDQMNFVQTLYDWAKRYELPLDVYVPGPVISDLDADNSLAAKWKIVSADAACSRWWTAYQTNQCDAY